MKLGPNNPGEATNQTGFRIGGSTNSGFEYTAGSHNKETKRLKDRAKFLTTSIARQKEESFQDVFSSSKQSNQNPVSFEPLEFVDTLKNIGLNAKETASIMISLGVDKQEAIDHVRESYS